MKTVTVSEFMVKCAALLDAVNKTGEALEITKRGKPLVRILPPQPTVAIFGAMCGEIRVRGDIISPLDERWRCET